MPQSVTCHLPDYLDTLESKQSFRHNKFLQETVNPSTHTNCIRCLLQECPEGVVHEDSFKDIYAKFFPHGSEYPFPSPTTNSNVVNLSADEGRLCPSSDLLLVLVPYFIRKPVLRYTVQNFIYALKIEMISNL